MEDDIIRGPKKHPRHGTSLEIRPTLFTPGGRLCSQALVVTTAARRMIELSKAGQKLETIAVIGGESDPASHPDFRQISENLRELSDKWFPRAKMVVETEPSYLSDAQVRHALSSYDRPVVRFSSGTQKCHGALTGESPSALKQAVANLSRVEHSHWVLEARFQRGSVDNSTDSELRAWIRNVSKAKPSAVTITTPPKATTHEGKQRRPVPRTRLKAIADLVAEKTGMRVEIVEEAE